MLRLIDPRAASIAPFLGSDPLSTRCPCRLRKAMSAQAVEHDLTLLEGSMDGLTSGFRIGSVHLAYVRYGTPTRVVAEPTADLVCWTIPVDRMQVSLGTQAAHPLRRGFVLDRERRTTMLPHPTGGAVVLTTSEARLTAHYRRLTGRTDEPCLDVTPGPAPLPLGYIDQAWRHAARVMEGPASPPAVLVQSLEEILLTSLLLELPSRAAGTLAGVDDTVGVTPSREHTRRAIEWAEQNLARPFTLQEWAAAVGVSVRHLQKSFQQHHGCSLTQFRAVLRLETAHQRLRLPDADTTVTRVAAEAGFTHLSRFAAAYRARYGTTPSQTLRAAGASRIGGSE